MPWGSRGGEYPARSSRGGGTLARGVPWPGGGYPAREVHPPGGYPAGGVPWPGGVPCRGGTQLGQHREYLLHGGRYASCVHAGGLSCLYIQLFGPVFDMYGNVCCTMTMRLPLFSCFCSPLSRVTSGAPPADI